MFLARRGGSVAERTKRHLDHLFFYSDIELRHANRETHADDAKTFLGIFEEEGVDVAEFSDALAASKHVELVELAKQLRSEIARGQTC